MKNDYEQLVTNFKSYFGKSALDYVFADETVLPSHVVFSDSPWAESRLDLRVI